MDVGDPAALGGAPDRRGVMLWAAMMRRRTLDDLALAVGTDPGLPTPCRWPAIPAELDQAAAAVARAVRQRRPTGPSIAHEERLDVDVDAVLAAALASPGSAGIPADLARRAGFDPGLREQLRWAGRARASHLWPMSLLLEYGIEDLICLAHDRWTARVDGRAYELVEGSPFASAQAAIDLFRDVVQLVGVTGDRRLNESSPVCEATLGSVGRLTVAIKPAVSGISPLRAALRLPARTGLRTLDDYVRLEVLPQAAADVLRDAVLGRANILIAGPASAGKTTLLRVLCGMVPRSEVVVVVEDGSELQLDADRGDGRPWVHSVIPLSTVENAAAEEGQRVTMMDQVRHALRFNPQRIILGESRGVEMAVVAKALMTGHAGSMTTIHAESAAEAIDQAAMYIREDARFSHSEGLARAIAVRAIHLVIHIAAIDDGRRVMTGMIGVDASGALEPLFERRDDGGYDDTVAAALAVIPRLRRRIRMPAAAAAPPARSPARRARTA